MTTPEPKNRLAKAVNDRTLRMIRADEEIVRQLAPETDTDRPQYPEQEFRRNFLPVITGEALKNLPDGFTPERVFDVATQCWAQIAGSMTQEVDVVEPDGTVAFTVPALMNTFIMDPAQPRTNAGLRAVNQEYQAKIHTLPEVAEKIMSTSLARKLTTLFKDEENVTNAEAKVKKMREYYGIDKTDGGQDQTSAKNTSFMGEMSFD